MQKQPEGPRTGSTGRGRQSKEGRECRYCGGLHARDKNKCPAFGKTCRKCGKSNHFQTVCLQRQSLHHVQEESSSDDEPVYCIETEVVGAVEHQQRKRFFATLCFSEGIDEVPLVPLVM